MPVTTAWWAGWYHSIEVLDDFSRFGLASDLKPDMGKRQTRRVVNTAEPQSALQSDAVVDSAGVGSG